MKFVERLKALKTSCPELNLEIKLNSKLDAFTPKILLVILLTVCDKILMVLVR